MGKMDTLRLVLVSLILLAWTPRPGADIPDEQFHEVTLYVAWALFDGTINKQVSQEVKLQVPTRFGDMYSPCLVDAPCKGWWRAQYPHPDKRYSFIVIYFLSKTVEPILIEERPKLGRGLWWFPGDPPSDVLEEDAVKYLNALCSKEMLTS